MANLRIGRRSLAVRGPRRKSVWIGFTPQLNTFTAAGGTLLGTLNAAALALRPFTVVRSHVVLMVHSDQTAASEDQVGAFGIEILSDQAVAAGVGSIPTPITEIGTDQWYVHQVFMASQLAGAIDAKRGEIYQIDSKAMRKVNIGEDMAIVAELSSQGSGFTLISGGRFLVKTF